MQMQQRQRQEEHIDSMIGIFQSDNTESKNMGWFDASHQSILLANPPDRYLFISKRNSHFGLFEVLNLLVSHILIISR